MWNLYKGKKLRVGVLVSSASGGLVQIDQNQHWHNILTGSVVWPSSVMCVVY